jgi:CheY-like chemotaxis protein
MTNILLVEDDVELRELLAVALEIEDYAVTQAGHGEEAIARLQEQSYDAVVVDLLMPVMDGLRLLHWIRDQAHMCVPVVVITSYDGTGPADDAVAAGANRMLHKPVAIPALLEAVEAVTGGAQA